MSAMSKGVVVVRVLCGVESVKASASDRSVRRHEKSKEGARRTKNGGLNRVNLFLIYPCFKNGTGEREGVVFRAPCYTTRK